jgi:putative transposase
VDEPTGCGSADAQSQPPATPVVAAGPSDLAAIPEELWALARERFAALKPLIESGRFDADAVGKRASECGLHRATLYRWLQQYLKQHTLASLLPQRPGPHAGGRSLSPAVENVIETALQNRYLTRQRLSPVHVARDVQLRCREDGLPVPSERTIRRRIRDLPQELQLRRRFGYTAAQSLAPLRGEFPDVDEPLGVIQIDHTPLDLILVDDIHRLPIGRPWLTLAIDIYTRMVAGFALAFEKPSALSVGLCLLHAIGPKDDWLSKHGLATVWPIDGVMRQIHCDNAREFRGEMLKKACEQYGIELAFRRVKSPWYGGHIERLLGTFAKEIHALEGTTFSNPQERGSYPSEKKAALTLTEFEQCSRRLSSTFTTSEITVPSACHPSADSSRRGASHNGQCRTCTGFGSTSCLVPNAPFSATAFRSTEFTTTRMCSGAGSGMRAEITAYAKEGLS